MLGVVVGTIFETLITAFLTLVVALLLLIVRWVFRVVGEKDKMASQILVSSIDARLEPRFRKLEDQVHDLSTELKEVRKQVIDK